MSHHYNFELKQVHIGDLKPGDTIDHDGAHRTVCASNLKRDPCVGLTVFGDSYGLGHKPVNLVVFLAPTKGVNP